MAVICYMTSVRNPTIKGWLKRYDIEACVGIGYIDLTEKIDQAMTFPNPLDAYHAYNSVPKVRPRRPDGKPNKPLTSFHMEIIDADSVYTLRK